ncbi:MAG TPA: chromosome segregation protein SMC [Vicinamibacterales bacterium]|nr:chromosome segregation protein SMC [Vicinamibacterales bacterium]
MKLSRLQISGFKSFPDRSELSFDHGVTAIVGPNGCGKSNVVDAITWVLGEQSAKSLRGASMEDVIFAGSDGRKPTAAAEVRLKLANVPLQAPELRAAHEAAVAGVEPGNGNGHHGNGHGNGHHAAAAAVLAAEALLDEAPTIVRDVEIGRRLYRSGESEYLIDGEVCRLRDVHDLLMDSGLGVKAYAVIEQGKIGQILSSRPADRRQLIEEAAGVTKYKNRRRSAELKLEAAEQNLTRVDDIIFEVEKQRGALKRQAARARRYRALREELRKWEQVQYAKRYRTLAADIDAASSRLTDARAREAAASARLAEVESTAERIRIELAEAEARATSAREQAHARELDIERRQQQIAFDRQQIETLQQAASAVSAELETLAERREPARVELASRREAAARAEAERNGATAALDALEQAYRSAYREIEGTESDVEAARSEVFSAMNAATALRHALETANASRERLSSELSRLDVERRDVEAESGRAEAARAAAAGDLARAREALGGIGLDRAARESELTTWRGERERQGADARALEHELAGMTARLSSLEQLERQRAEYGDAARLLLADTGTDFSHRGSVADWLDVDDTAVRAVEALLGDLVEFIVVESQAQAETGLRIAHERGAGRVGFLVLGEAGAAGLPAPSPDVRPLASVVCTTDPAGASVVQALGGAWIADSRAAAMQASARTTAPVATWSGDVCRNGRLIQGGARQDARGILETKREIRELRDRAAEARAAVDRLREDLLGLDTRIAASEAAVVALTAEQHNREKSIVGLELQAAGAGEAVERFARRLSLIDAEHHRAEEERRALELREEEARASIARIEGDQKAADTRLSEAQRRLFGVRESAEAHAREVAEGKAREAALIERASALSAEVQRLVEAGAELETRMAARQDDLARNGSRREELRLGIIESERLLDDDVRAFTSLKDDVRSADDDSSALRIRFDAEEQDIRAARRTQEAVRGEATQYEVADAKAQADLQHLSDLCFETLAASIADVTADVDRLEADGALVLPLKRQPKEAAADGEQEPEQDLEEQGTEPAEPMEPAEPVEPGSEARMTLDEALSVYRQRIERLGPVNMMAIEQFDELETRHTFLTTQRKDLIDSIRTTNEAIKRIDKTTKERFREAFETINTNFERTFSTLFGGGRAGLTLLDSDEQTEAGIDIHAQPPGKRLQNVQLLSGGEKAMTAMALMFAIFRYRPSPFCLLDEIDAPLDDANIGRFVEMLQGMQDHTQFILITHNRKTMEIADRLYGVTMEEPGVSKLISVNLN